MKNPFKSNVLSFDPFLSIWLLNYAAWETAVGNCYDVFDLRSLHAAGREEQRGCDPRRWNVNEIDEKWAGTDLS